MANEVTTPGKVFKFALPVILFLAGMILLFIRNPDPFLNPIVYAEDGTWTGIGLTEGWLHAIVNARSDYFVAINILLLLLSTKISSLVTDSPLVFLPQAIALTSYGFYSATATFAFFTLRRISPAILSLLGYIFLLLVPLGVTQNEIIGRLMQVGFYMPLLAVMLLFWRDRLKWQYLKILVDASLLLCAATNPVVFALVFIYLLYNISIDWSLELFIKRTITLIAPFAILMAFLLPRMVGNGDNHGGLVSANLIEGVIARPLLYPYVFPWYSSLSDAVSIALLFLFISFVWFAHKKSTNKEARWLILFTALTLIVCDLATIVNRPGLTGILSNYQTTFPDRYFMGLNVLVVLLTMLCLSQLSQKKAYRIYSVVLLLAIFGVYVWHSPLIFESTASRLPLKTQLDFSEQICLSELSTKVEGESSIQIYPLLPRWKMIVPGQYINKDGCEFTSYFDAGIARVGDEYKMQPSVPLSASTPIGILTSSDHQHKNAGLERIGVLFGTYGKQNPGEVELRLKASDGSEFVQRFTLPDLADNKYRYFDLDSKSYTTGEIVSISGGGVSTWESHNERGHATCILYEYAGGKRRFTPGCLLPEKKQH